MSSDAEIAKVEISMDSGASWHEAQLSKQEPNAWTLWEYDWRTRSNQAGEPLSRARLIPEAAPNRSIATTIAALI